MEKKVYDAQRRHTYQPFGDVCETIQAAYGTGGNNVPLVVETGVESSGLITKGNGEVILSAERHTALTVGGGQAGQGYPCVFITKRDDMTYQNVTGALTPGAHPGSYNGQDAYNDMLIANVNEGGDAMNSVVRRLTPLE